MRELVRADWYRIRKSGLFLLLAICILVISLLSVEPYIAMVSLDEGVLEADTSNVLAFALIAGAACAVLCGYTEETGYTEGLVRNQLIAGHTRSEVFAASFVSGTLCGLVFAAVYLTPMLAFQYAFMKPPVDLGAFWLSIVTGILTIPAFVSVYALTAAIWGRKGTGLACMTMYAVLVAIALAITQVLSEPKYVQDYVIGHDGLICGSGAMIRNPDYICPPARYVYEFLVRFLPSGSSILAISMQSGPAWPYPIGFTAVCCAAGLAVLSRKNIN